MEGVGGCDAPSEARSASWVRGAEVFTDLLRVRLWRRPLAAG
jgi:hypothetical protein